VKDLKKLKTIKEIKMQQYKPDNKILAPCYVTDMPSDIYHSHDSISNSGLKLISRSPAHYKYQPEREPTRNLVIGSALHMAVLEPDLYRETYFNSGAADRRAKVYKDLADEYGGEFVLTANEADNIDGIANSLWDKYSVLLSLPGNNELSGFSADPETGVVCRHRFDKLTQNRIAIDLKTAVDARPEAFSKSIHAYGYHMQQAFYSDQYEWITGRMLNDFIFLVVESSAPYACKSYRINQESIDIGRDIYRKCLDEYAKCRESGIWPAYSNDGIEEISIPSWAINQHDKQQIESFVFMED